MGMVKNPVDMLFSLFSMAGLVVLVKRDAQVCVRRPTLAVSMSLF